jgi:lipid-binding SYLF domain-containing protein
MKWLLTLSLPAALIAPMAIANDHEDVLKRLNASTTVMKEIFDAPDKGIPHDLMDKAHCVVVVPNLKQAGFIVGAKYGKGFVSCRRPNGGWTGPAAVRIEGGSFGLQIGAGETDLIALVMNESGARRMMSSEFKVGGEAQAMAGPVGRSLQAETDATMKAEILGYSRSRGVFAGIALEGSTIREDRDDNRALYAMNYTNKEILENIRPKTPGEALPFIEELNSQSRWEKHG